jgi:hypothetical protein
MLSYRFRLTSAEQEDFIREIEIQPQQTFLDFHDIIVSCTDLDACQNAVFFNTDKKYKPHAEISLKPQKKQVKKYDEELDEIITETNLLHLMKNSLLKTFIEDPHQKMIYEFTGKDFYIFNIELFKIQKTEENYLLPRCIKKVGELPKKVEIPILLDELPAKEKEPLIQLAIPIVRSSIFIDLKEDETEIAEIETHLNEFLEMDEPEIRINGLPSAESEDEDSFPSDEEGHMESLEDYEDIENLEIKLNKFDRDSDDF